MNHLGGKVLGGGSKKNEDSKKANYEYKKDEHGRTYYIDNTGRVHYVMQGTFTKSIGESFSKLSTYGGVGYDLITKGGPLGTLLGLSWNYLDTVWDNWSAYYYNKNDKWIGTNGKTN
ncbi:hypothetical protein [Pseudopedobacter beijingensis]|uniref:RHS repeat-associated core domain-containing protein n=1 Tax=Pseudopedobacter beijingensis TaxID=1207056 RepID=A0ABW4IJ69_9SPHI